MGHEDTSTTQEADPADTMDSSVAHILVSLDVLSMSNSNGKQPRFKKGEEKVDTNYHKGLRSVSAEKVLTLEDGSWIDVVGERTDVDGIYDPDAIDASYQLTFIRSAGPEIEPHPIEVFSIEKYRDREYGDPTLTVWDVSKEGVMKGMYSGEQLAERPELETLSNIEQRLDIETDALARLHFE